MVVAGRTVGFSCSASRESLPMGAGRLDTGRSGVTTSTGRPVLKLRPEPAPAGVTAGDRPAVAAGTVTGPGSLVADDGMPILTATVAAVATMRTARTLHTVRMHPFSYRTGGHDRRAVGSHAMSQVGHLSRCSRQPAGANRCDSAPRLGRSPAVDERQCGDGTAKTGGDPVAA